MTASVVSDSELAERQRQWDLHQANEKLAKYREEIRGLRISINLLIREEKRLLQESAALEPMARMPPQQKKDRGKA